MNERNRKGVFDPFVPKTAAYYYYISSFRINTYYEVLIHLQYGLGVYWFYLKSSSDDL